MTQSCIAASVNIRHRHYGFDGDDSGLLAVSATSYDRMVVMQRTAELPGISSAPGELEIVRRFVNTLDIDRGTDELDAPGALLGWLRESGLAGPGRDRRAGWPVTEADLRRAVALREALRGVLSCHLTAGSEQDGTGSPDRADGRASAAAAAAGLREAAAALRIRFEVSDDGQVAAAPGGSGGAADLARLLLITAAAATTGTWNRLKVCSAGNCQWAFYDRSPTRTGCWCSMRGCGSRAKSRAYRRRTAGRANAE
jgi:predicted RNA-binding Zn ribbon-like protein